jgi:hypothetical protein
VIAGQALRQGEPNLTAAYHHYSHEVLILRGAATNNNGADAVTALSSTQMCSFVDKPSQETIIGADGSNDAALRIAVGMTVS